MKSTGDEKDIDNSNEMESLARKSRAILNKVTPQNIEKLAKQFNELELDTNEKMQMCINILFDMALDEPANIVTYARLCELLQYKGLTSHMNKQSQRVVSFRRVLLCTCQKEFERDYMEGIEMLEVDNETTETKLELKRHEWIVKERRARKRSLGNIRLIGELFKLGMLTVRIIHDCIRELLQRQKEEATESRDESLECLCKLITTVGTKLEKDTIELLNKSTKDKTSSIKNLEFYFIEINALIQNKATSPRIRFMMQDLVDLRRNKWVPRRQALAPKTIDAIHAELEKERTLEKLMGLTSVY